jgi:hypothetical protein
MQRIVLHIALNGTGIVFVWRVPDNVVSADGSTFWSDDHTGPGIVNRKELCSAGGPRQQCW